MAKRAMDDEVGGGSVPLLYGRSDSRGAVALGRVPNVKAVVEVRAFFDENYDEARPTAVFHTFANGILRREIRRELDGHGIPSIDLLGPAVTILSTLTGEEPSHAIGATFNPDAEAK